MAYRDANGAITIDEAAANADITKIRGAISKLEASRDSLRQLRSTASGMHGQTGSAIVEQCDKLQNQINVLNEKLNYSIQYIRKTVAKYEEQDRQLAAMIKSGGGV